MIVYGVGAHFYDMLDWHPELKKKITRVFDKAPDKIGHRAKPLAVRIEAPEGLRKLPDGTVVAVAAIRYFSEIKAELLRLNPGLDCQNIDVVYERMVVTEGLCQMHGQYGGTIPPEDVDAELEVYLKLYDVSRRNLRAHGLDMPISRRAFFNEIQASCEGMSKGLSLHEYIEAKPYEYLETVSVRLLHAAPADEIRQEFWQNLPHKVKKFKRKTLKKIMRRINARR